MFQPESNRTPLLSGVAFFLWLAAFLCLAGAGCSKSPAPAPTPESLLREARTALRRSDFERVRDFVQQIPNESVVWQSAMLLAGEAATKQTKYTEAIEYYRMAVESDPKSDEGLLALFSAAEIYLETGQLTIAEKHYNDVLKLQPGNGITNERMAFLLSLTGRRWESLAHYAVLIKSGDSNYRELALAADVGRSVEQPEFLQKCVRLAPADKLVSLAMAVQAFDEGRPEAIVRLQEFVNDHPTELAAQTMLAELLLETADGSAFIKWYRSLPETARFSPDVWFVCGVWARKQGELGAAAECFWQTATAMPYHRKAVYMLGQTLVAMGDPQAEAVTQNSALLVELSQTVDQVLASEGRNTAAIQKTTELLLQLGRIWEACAWAQYSVNAVPDVPWAHRIIEQHGGSLRKDLPMVTKILRPSIDLRSGNHTTFLELIERKAALADSDGTSHIPAGEYETGIRYRECSLIPFTYDNADDPLTKGVRTFEQTGGGVAIIDFDLDGAPDVFLTQGTEWKTGEDRPRPASGFKDALFRNRFGKRFDDAHMGLVGDDSGYGQGCSAGDFDNDGFPDLYVANVGRNALKQNMGDGTFLDTTNAAGITQEVWTSSVMICDLNADSLPDLFDVNYLTGDNVYQLICMGRSCSPSVFDGARDCVLINQGDGRFVAAPELTPEANSKGLGIVAFSAAPGNPRPDLFVANDQVGNHFLRNQSSENGHRLEFEENALISGLAYNEHGLAMACMGVAADDWDGNGLLDLFVTNFHNEANTMYLQDSKGLFLDATNSMGLKAASLSFTGWGTQSLDANLDGYPDLVVANGHVDDYRDVGEEYQMRPQFFQNRGARFEEIMNGDCGEWFTQKFLGRGLARVDWNLDGLPEFIVSNINSPVSVIVNETKSFGHFLNVRLISTQGARDAAGTFVNLELNGKSILKQLSMGDGYMATNERVIQFGIGSQTRVSGMTVHWPSGITTSFSNPGVDATWIVVEGRDGLVRLQTP